MRRNSQYRPIVVNQGTLPGDLLRCSSATTPPVLAAPPAGSIACTIVDVDDDQAKRIVIGDNRTAKLWNLR